MSAAKSVTATFNLNPVTYTLTVAKAGTGSGTVTSSPAGISCGADCSEPYNSGTVVTLTQRRHRRLDLRRLERRLHRNRRLLGHHERRQVRHRHLQPQPGYTLTVAKAGTGSGTVTSSPAGISCGADCSEPYNSGTVVTLSRRSPPPARPSPAGAAPAPAPAPARSP